MTNRNHLNHSLAAEWVRIFAMEAMGNEMTDVQGTRDGIDCLANSLIIVLIHIVMTPTGKQRYN